MRRVIKSAVIAIGAAAAITILVLGSSGASANSCTAEHPCELERVEPPIDPPVWENQLMLRAMAQQQQTLLALNSVMVQMQLVQIEIANTLHQIQATQASGGSK